MQQPKEVGNNINQKIDIGKTAFEFVNYFYTNWKVNPIALNTSVIRKFSVLKNENCEYKGLNFTYFMNTLKTGAVFDIAPKKMEYLDSGSRRIDISVFGNISKNGVIKNFFQTFSICYHPKNNWFIKNSTLMIL